MQRERIHSVKYKRISELTSPKHLWVLVIFLFFHATLPASEDSVAFAKIHSQYKYLVYSNPAQLIDELNEYKKKDLSSIDELWVNVIQSKAWLIHGDYVKAWDFLYPIDSLELLVSLSPYGQFQLAKARHDILFQLNRLVDASFEIDKLKAIYENHPENLYYKAYYFDYNYYWEDLSREEQIERRKQTYNLLIEIGDSVMAAEVYSKAIANLFRAKLTDSVYHSIEAIRPYLERTQNYYYALSLDILEASLLFESNRDDEGFAKLQTLIKKAEDRGYYFVQIIAHYQIIQRLRQQNRTDEAIPMITKVIKICKRKHNIATYETFMRMLIEYYRDNKEYKKLYETQQEYLHITDSIDEYINIPMTQYIQRKAKQQKQTADLQIAKQQSTLEKDKEENRFFSLTLLALIIILGVILYFIIVVKKRKDDLAQKELLDKRYELQNRELSFLAIGKLQQSELIKSFVSQLNKIKTGISFKYKAETAAIINEIDKYADAGAWTDFQSRFDQIYPDFQGNIQKAHPELTKSEIKLCLLLRLDLSTKEIANVLAMTPASVQSKRGRIRIKMNLNNTETNLFQHLSQF